MVITNITIASNDDTLVFKSDWALGQRFTNQISNISFSNVNLTVPGGSADLGTAVPSNNATAGSWSVQPDLRTGLNQYADRTCTFSTVPAGLVGAQWIQTGTQLTKSETPSRSFEVYANAFPAGQISLGPAAEPAKASSMYTVMVS